MNTLKSDITFSVTLTRGWGELKIMVCFYWCLWSWRLGARRRVKSFRACARAGNVPVYSGHSDVFLFRLGPLVVAAERRRWKLWRQA